MLFGCKITTQKKNLLTHMFDVRHRVHAEIPNNLVPDTGGLPGVAAGLRHDHRGEQHRHHAVPLKHHRCGLVRPHYLLHGPILSPPLRHCCLATADRCGLSQGESRGTVHRGAGGERGVCSGASTGPWPWGPCTFIALPGPRGCRGGARGPG